MPTIDDDAWATPITVLRPSFDHGAGRPQAALVVRFPGDPRTREMVLRGLLRRRWQLVAAPVGEFEPAAVPRARVAVIGDRVVVEAEAETVFDGSLSLHHGAWGQVWRTLAQATGEVVVLLTVGPTPVLTADDADAAARAGHLVGIAGILI